MIIKVIELLLRTVLFLQNYDIVIGLLQIHCHILPTYKISIKANG